MIPPQINVHLPSRVEWRRGEVQGTVDLQDGSGKQWEAILLELEERSAGGVKRILGRCRLDGPFLPSVRPVSGLPFHLGFHQPGYSGRQLFQLPGKWGKKVAEGLDFLRLSVSEYHVAAYLLPREGEPMLLGLFPVEMA